MDKTGFIRLQRNYQPFVKKTTFSTKTYTGWICSQNIPRSTCDDGWSKDFILIVSPLVYALKGSKNNAQNRFEAVVRIPKPSRLKLVIALFSGSVLYATQKNNIYQPWRTLSSNML